MSPEAVADIIRKWDSIPNGMCIHCGKSPVRVLKPGGLFGRIPPQLCPECAINAYSGCEDFLLEPEGFAEFVFIINSQGF